MIDEASKEEHRALRGLAAELLEVAGQRDGEAVSAVRWRLFRLLLVHLARGIVGLCADDRTWRRRWRTIIAPKWAISAMRCASISSTGRSSASRPTGTGSRRIDREDAHLYPMAERIALRPAA